jgi:hypothetical protein
MWMSSDTLDSPPSSIFLYAMDAIRVLLEMKIWGEYSFPMEDERLFNTPCTTGSTSLKSTITRVDGGGTISNNDTNLFRFEFSQNICDLLTIRLQGNFLWSLSALVEFSSVGSSQKEPFSTFL